jgi:NADPH-dependent curcumin reductase CurA
MNLTGNKQIHMVRRPVGMPTDDCFELRETLIPTCGDGQVLRRTLYLSLDPYFRLWMKDAAVDRAAGITPLMIGKTISEVVESANPKFAAGELVCGNDGWQEYGISDGSDLTKADPDIQPVTLLLGPLGGTAFTAYGAMVEICKPKPGETLVVSAAAGAVGSIAGQIGKIWGCRVVGLAGSDEKCRWVTEDLGFDACVNYKTESVSDALARACPNGIDAYYDNVAGSILEAVLEHINYGARIALVGLISQYNATEPPVGPNLWPLLAHNAMIHGFQNNDALGPQFGKDMRDWLAQGKIRYREHIVDGIERAPRAFMGLFRGENIGKAFVRI